MLRLKPVKLAKDLPVTAVSNIPSHSGSMAWNLMAALTLLTATTISSGAALAAGGSAAAKLGITSEQSAPQNKTVSQPNLQSLEAIADIESKTGDSLAVTWGDRGFPQAIFGNLGNFGTPNEAAARNFLAQQSTLFKLRPDAADLALVDQKTTPGGTHFSFQQNYAGVKVFNGLLSVSFDGQGNVVSAGGDYFSAISLPSIKPQIDAATARQTLLQSIPSSATTPPASVNELVVLVDDQNVASLAYHIIQPTFVTTGQSATYEGFVDAIFNTLIGKPHDINLYATGQVYKNGNAMAATGNSNLKDGSAVPASAYQTVTLPRLTSATGLIGSYADAHTLTTAAWRATPDASGNYLFTRNTSTSLGTKFDAVNTYYYVDFAQNYIQSLGFNNINNRSVRFNVNGTTDDNSWYQPNGSGTGDLTLGSGGVDDAEDAEVVLHEYGHAIHDNSKPNIWGGNGVAGSVARTGAIGEGWGDYFAASITTQFFNQANTPYATTLMEWDASSYSNSIPPSIRSITSAKHYPQNVTGEVHDDGEIWSSTLWQIRSDFITLANNYANGAKQADKLFLQSHFLLTSSNNTFTDGANAILTAANALGYTQAQKNAITNRFVARGILNIAPNGPTGLNATAISASQIHLSWTDNSNNETGFKIERATAAAGPWTLITTTAANATSYSNTGLAASTTYYYRVRATNAVGDSINSNVANATTLVALPAAPSVLSATSVSASQIHLAWTDNSNNETGFKVERATAAAGPWTLITITAANIVSYSNTGLAASTTYYYRVRAKNSSGDSANSNTANATTRPAAPSNLHATTISSSQINLTWADASSNETGFKVERATSSLGPWALIATTAANATSYHSTGLAPFTVYYYRVRAASASGDSAASNIVIAKTLPIPPAAPSGLTATVISPSQINLAWADNSSNETGFKVERAFSTAGPWNLIATTTANITSYHNTGLTPSTIYFYRVRATNQGGDSANSNLISARTR